MRSSKKNSCFKKSIRSFFKNRLYHSLILLLIGGLFLSCGLFKSSDRETIYKRNTLRIAILDDAHSLDPSIAFDVISLEILPHFAEALYTYEYLPAELADANKTRKVIPLLAADLPAFSKDRKKILISIKKGVFYAPSPLHPSVEVVKNLDKRELKASDFIYSWKRLADPKLASQGLWIFRDKILGYNDFVEKMDKATTSERVELLRSYQIPGMTAVDDYTIEIKLSEPYPQLLHTLTMTFTAPLPPEVPAEYFPVGTGPFVLAEWKRGYQLVLKRNKNYRNMPMPEGFFMDSHKPTPHLDEVYITMMREPQPAWLSFLKGGYDVIRIPKENMDEILGPDAKVPENVKIRFTQVPQYFYIAFNIKDKYLSNKYLRQAISSALNRQEWIKNFAPYRGVVMDSIIPPTIPGRPAKTAILYDYDLKKAKELLAKAGYPDGKGLPEFAFDLRGSDSQQRQLGEWLQEQLRRIGVKIQPNLNTFPAFLDKRTQGRLQISYGGWYLDFPDAENATQLLYSKNVPPGNNDMFFASKEFDSLYLKMKDAEDGPQRDAWIKRMDEIVQEECPWAFGYYLKEVRAYYTWVENFVPYPFIRDLFRFYKVDVPHRVKLMEARQL